MHRITRKQEIEMSKAQTDIRTTSYDALTANPVGYQGTLDDVLAQVRAEKNIPAKAITARQELYRFLGITKAKSELSGTQAPGPHMPGVYIFPMNEDEDDSVQYGKPDADDALLVELFDQPKHSRFSLEYALKAFPGSFMHKV
jgi:hypothetical protein